MIIYNLDLINSLCNNTRATVIYYTKYILEVKLSNIFFLNPYYLIYCVKLLVSELSLLFTLIYKQFPV